VQVFHYHLVTSKVRQIEGRYLGKLAFGLVARYGRIQDDTTTFESGTSWEDLDDLGFKLRLTELERGAVNVVVQPGQWSVPRVDHIGLALDEDEFEEALDNAARRDLRVQEHGGRRTFVATGVGYRLELHPPRDWLDDLLDSRTDFQLSELHLRADDPRAKTEVLADVLGVPADGTAVELGETIIRFVPGGPPGRPELHGELFS
jgi:hypothetical protein